MSTTISERALVDPDAHLGRALLAGVAGDRSETIADRVAVAMFTPACLASGRLELGLSWLRTAGFSVVFLSPVRLTRERVDRLWLYQCARFTAERWDVAARLFCAGPAVVAVVTHADRGRSSVAERLKGLQGPSEPELLAEHHLRACLGAVNKLNNLVHVPDDAAATVRELPILLGERGAVAAWDAAVTGGRAPEGTEAVAGLEGAADDGVCLVRAASRLRWRALVLGEELAGSDAPPALRSALSTDLEWAASQPWGGLKTIEAWRRRFGPLRAGEGFARWLGPGSVLTQAMTHVDAVVSGGCTGLRALRASVDAAGLAPSTWELLAVETQAVAQDLARRG